MINRWELSCLSCKRLSNPDRQKQFNKSKEMNGFSTIRQSNPIIWCDGKVIDHKRLGDRKSPSLLRGAFPVLKQKTPRDICPFIPYLTNEKYRENYHRAQPHIALFIVSSISSSVSEEEENEKNRKLKGVSDSLESTNFFPSFGKKRK